jgi:hypothetical protein
MATDPRLETHTNPFGPDYDQVADDPRRRSKWATCLMGCLGVLAVLMILAVIAGVWIGRNWRGWVAGIGSQAVNQGIDSSDLPPQEKVEVKEQVDRVTKAFRAGQISTEQAGAIVDKLMHSPLMPSLVVATVGKRYFDRSGLSDEEKDEGRKTLKRFTRGMVDKKINDQGIDAVMTHVADRQANNQWQLRQQVSDQELRAALTEAKARADAAGIAEEPEDFDASDEVKRIIDETLKEKQ